MSINLYTVRDKCVFCENRLTKIYFQYDKSICLSANMCDDNSQYTCIPYNISICENCDCYQNKYLGDINLVYCDNHNNIIISNTWTIHYNNFFEFIINNCSISKSSSILEIGAGNNYIASLFVRNNFDSYCALEPVITEKIENVNYIKGWLEDLQITTNYELVLLSHVFEHLYNPHDLFRIKSKYIAISIPNIPQYLDNKILNFLNIEHTFYFEEIHITNLFDKYQYKLIAKQYFTNHSIFMLFEFDKTIDITKNYTYCTEFVKNIDNRFSLYFNFVHNMVKKINCLVRENINTNYVLFPCNMYIQYLITFGLDTSNIKYLYDNNTAKKDKYLYGTNLKCKNIEYFIENPNYTIILLGFLYNDEIKTILKKNNIEFLTL